MKGKPRKSLREKDLTVRFVAGQLDDDLLDSFERFGSRSKHYRYNKTLRTALMRAAEKADLSDLQSMPVGQVVQVYSLYCDVEHQGLLWRCVVRKTLAELIRGDLVVGDMVRFRDLGTKDENDMPQAVIEQILPRQTVLARADSFNQNKPQPIVANAQQMLIVASVREPEVKWGLIDRMLTAARSGGLEPIICLNKIDLQSGPRDGIGTDHPAPHELLYYSSLGIKTLQTSVPLKLGIDALRDVLRNRTTVLAGHSGVGKSSLILAVQPGLNIRIGQISHYSGKGRHTTTFVRRYTLEMGGHVIDTPGVRLFGLWGVTRENLIDHFPDVAASTAPPWRQESYQRILASLPEE